MIRIVIILILVSGQIFGQTVLTKPYRTFVNCHGEWTDPLYDYAQSTTYTHDQNNEWDNAGEVVADIIDTVTALPASGWIEADKLYTWEGLIVRCRQSHNRTIYDPTETLALFTIYRPAEVDMQWIAGEQVDVGTIRIYNEVTYECIQAHVTQSDWTPTATLNVLWKEVTSGEEYPVWVQPTGAHDSYNIGDIVWFPTEGSTLYESLINANVWSPVTYSAGWREYTP